MSQTVVDEFYLQHETVRHILDDLRNLPACHPDDLVELSPPLNKSEASNLAISLAEALSRLI